MKDGMYFKWTELVNSPTAKNNHIDNTPTCDAEKNLEFLIDRLDEIRDAFCMPIYVSSGYRCPELNRRVGGAKNSQHMTGCAVDLNAGNKDRNRALFELIRRNFEYDQLINEYDFSWVHFSVKNSKNRHQVLSQK